MLGRWSNARLRAAERALAAGRLDEALAAATHPSVAKHRKVGRLLDQLTPALLARARVNAQAGHYAEALVDIDQLERLDRGEPERGQLRQRIEGEQTNRRQQRDNAAQTYQAAKARVAEGRLESARLAVDRVGNDQRRERLLADLDARAQRSAALLAQATTALERGDLAAATKYWDEAVQRHGRTTASDEFLDRLRPKLATTLEGWLASGEVLRFMQTVRPLSSVLEADPALAEFARTASGLDKAAAELARRDHDAAKRALLRLSSAADGADWVQRVVAALGRVQAAYDELLASPLGALLPESQPGAAGKVAPSEDFSLDASLSAPPALPPSVLMLDGACAALLLTQDVIRIGRESHRKPVDLPLPADVEAHHADIYRQGEDYFLVAHGPTTVNHQRVTRVLLRDGDRIKFAERAKFVFRRPSRRSVTAVLSASGHQRLANDVSEVVLLADTCLIGPNGRAHLQTPGCATRLVLSVSGLEVSARDLEDGAGRGRPLVYGEHRQIGDQGITLIEASR